MDQPRGIFCDKLNIHTDKFVFIRKKGVLGHKDAAAMFFRHIDRIFGGYFTADFAVNGIPHRVGSGRSFPKFESRENLFGRMSVAGIFFHARPFLLRFSYPRSLAEFIYRKIKTTSSRATITFKPQAAAFKV